MKRLISVLLAALMLLQIPAAAAEQSLPPLFEASFVQSWLCRDWTAERFAEELNCMKAAGFRSLILQSTVDLTYRQTDHTKPKTDPSAYTLETAYALYPSVLAAGSEQACALENALNAAKQTGMQIWIGLVSDDRWWNYGWGEPAAGMQTWLDRNAEQNCTVIRELASLYGDRYAEQIAGFYFTNEYWNVEQAGEGIYEMLYATQLETVREQLAASFPEQRMLLSPFYNQDLTDAEIFGGFLVDLVRGGGLRQTDIIALQDGAGHGYDPDTIREWYEMSGCMADGAVTVWVNNETCTPELTAVPAEQLRADYLATAGAARHILFSWNHYYHGKEGEESFTALLDDLAGDINADGVCDRKDAACLLRWLRHEAAPPVCWGAADLDGSASLDVGDLTRLKRLILMREQ